MSSGHGKLCLLIAGAMLTAPAVWPDTVEEAITMQFISDSPNLSIGKVKVAAEDEDDCEIDGLAGCP